MKDNPTLDAVITEDMSKTICTHCGDECIGDYPVVDDMSFCCNGCQVIYQVLEANGLSAYYQLNDVPGISQKSSASRSYEYLDDADVVANYWILEMVTSRVSDFIYHRYIAAVVFGCWKTFINSMKGSCIVE